MDLPTSPRPISPKFYQPATFQERGVAVPFTAPALAGVRVRQETRHGLVLVIPNPTGVRGVYVVPWSAMRDECQPTLHDTMLNEKVSVAAAVTPSAVRAAARQVAMTGAAGRAAQAAAGVALRAEAAAWAATVAFLMQAWPGQADATEVTAAAAVLEGLGVGAAGRGTMPARVARLHAFAASLASAATREDDETGSVAAIAALAGQAASCAEHVLAAALALARDRAGFAEGWATHPERTAAYCARPAWVLDGWTLPTLLWDAAEDEMARRAAAAEMAPLLSPLPAEVSDWMGRPIASIPLPPGRSGLAAPDWRSSVGVLDLVARNESFRAMSA